MRIALATFDGTGFSQVENAELEYSSDYVTLKVGGNLVRVYEAHLYAAAEAFHRMREEELKRSHEEALVNKLSGLNSLRELGELRQEVKTATRLYWLRKDEESRLEGDWIPVTRSTPKFMEPVLITCENEPHALVGTFNGNVWRIVGEGMAKAVTHWQPLPEKANAN